MRPGVRAQALLVAALAWPVAATELPGDGPPLPDPEFVTPEAPALGPPPPAPPAEMAPIAEPATPEPEDPSNALEEGLASWYGPRFHGRRTASGERFDQEALTAAHRTLPFGTVVRVKSLVNGRTVDVRINDRGPHLKRRIIDLSRGAARALGLLQAGSGTKPVALSIVESRR